MPELFEQHAAGTLTIAKFWEFHYEHRHFFPKLAMFGLGLLTRGNALANMYLTELLLLAILAVFIIAVRERLTSGLAVWLMVPVAFLVFSFRQWENMLWGFQVAFVMPVAAALVAFLCLARMKNERFVAMFGGALFSATVAAFSALHGLIAWPVGTGATADRAVEQTAKDRLGDAMERGRRCRMGVVLRRICHAGASPAHGVFVRLPASRPGRRVV